MSILKKILEDKRIEVEQRKSKEPLTKLKGMLYFNRKCISLLKALQTNDVAIIAEIKRASPSKGVIRENFNHIEIARDYVSAGASAISVLTDEKYFQGNINFLSDIRPFVDIPILRKDFIIDPYQLVEAKAYGADAVLLIVNALSPQQLIELHTEANELGLECLVEVHTEQELQLVDFSKIKLIGINNRNLNNFTVNISNTIKLASKVPKGITIVSESGVSSRSEIDLLLKNDVRAVLVGESLMKKEKPGEALKELLKRDNDESKS